MASSILDRRSALKARHRAAILAAAEALVEERGGATFGVDELAERADVARRTVFNHFTSLEDVLLAVCTDALTVIVDDFIGSVASTPVGDSSRASLLDELAAAIHRSDLPAAIARVVRITGDPESAQARMAHLAAGAFSRIGDRLLAEVLRRHPDVDPLDAELLVGSTISGISTIARHWAARTDVRLTAASRAVWAQLVARLMQSLRAGQLPD